MLNQKEQRKHYMIEKINQPKISIKQTETNKKTCSFKGPETAVLTGLRALSNSQAIGASAVDLCSMVIPRTAVETKNRGIQAGIESGIREGSSWLLFACVGLIGYAASLLTSGKFNNEFKVKAQNIYASGNTVKNMSALWENAGGNQKQYFEGFLKSIKGLSGTEWKNVSADTSSQVVENLVKLADKSKELANSSESKSILKKEVKDLKNLVMSQIVKDTGASASYVLKADGAAKSVSSTLGELVDNAVVLSNSFEGRTKEGLQKFVKALSSNKTISTVLGLAVCAALCMSVQPLNTYLTKKRTGEDGFVGVQDRKADDSKGFKALKTAIGVGFSAFAISTIGKLSELGQNTQFNSKFASINQFKLLYGLTITSRFMAARDKNELRECVIKDTLGFTNWLIFGGLVSKLIARGIGGKELINNPVVKENCKSKLGYAFNWLSKAGVKSFDEVLLPKMKDIAKDGKVRKFSEMFMSADSATKSKILKIAGSQVAGYLYSGLVLGIGISKLNIFITRKFEAKKAEKEQKKPVINNGEKPAQSGLNNVFKNAEQKKQSINTSYFKYAKEDLSDVFKDFA